MSVVNAVRNPRSYLVDALGTYRLLLFNPGRFYEELDNRGLRKELALVVVISAIMSAGAYFTYTRVMTPYTVNPSMGERIEIQNEIGLRLLGLGIEPFIFSFGLIWIGFTAGFYVLSWAYNERGRFRHLLKNTAWGMVPLIGTGIVQSIGWAYVANGIEVEGNNPTLWFQSANLPRGTVSVRVQYIWNQVAEEPVAMGASVVGLVFMIWAWYIWAHGIVDVRKIELREAYIAAAVPTILYVIYTVATVLGYI